jgi:triacylglycerol lipase
MQRRLWLIAAAAASAGLAAGGVAVAGPAAALPPARSIKLFGANIRYHELDRAGAKPTLVLVHGMGSSALGDWGQVMGPLSQTHHVLALDLLGFGQSDKPVIAYGIQTWVDFLGEFLRAKRVGDFTLIGESPGGWIAAQYTLQALKGGAVGSSFTLPRPTRLVLCDSAGFRETFAMMQGNPATGTPPLSLAGEKALLGLVFHAPRFSDEQAVRGGMAWSLGKGDTHTLKAITSNPALGNEVLDSQLAGITIPTLVLWGEHDRLIPLAMGRRFAAEIPGAQLVVVPDTGHAPMIETPAAWLRAVQPFLTP